MTLQAPRRRYGWPPQRGEDGVGMSAFSIGSRVFLTDYPHMQGTVIEGPYTWLGWCLWRIEYDSGLIIGQIEGNLTLLP